MNKFKMTAYVFACFMVAGSSLSLAESGGADWNTNWDSSSVAARTLKLQQADLIRKSESGYYKNLGKTTINNTYNTDNRDGTFTEVNNVGDGDINVDAQVGDNIDENTNVIGAVNTSTNTITIDGDNNTVDVANEATNNGCQDGSINVTTIDQNSSSGGHTNGTADCN